jgi:hypothetical protein
MGTKASESHGAGVRFAARGPVYEMEGERKRIETTAQRRLETDMAAVEMAVQVHMACYAAEVVCP